MCPECGTPAAASASLFTGRGDDAVDLAGLAQSDRRLDIGVGGAPASALTAAAGQARGVHIGQVEALERSRPRTRSRRPA